MSYEQKSSRRDHLTSTTKDNKIELTEQELSRASGGMKYYDKGAPGVSLADKTSPLLKIT